MGEEVLIAVIVGMGHTPRVAWNKCWRKSRAKTGNSIQAPGVGVAEAPGRAGHKGVGAVIVREWPVIAWTALAIAAHHPAPP
ncbi:MAG: hypothetical protein AB1404_10045 [Spirochaetota bacterium]